MIANYGYADAAGAFFIAIDTSLCNGCGECVSACPAQVLEVTGNEWDPLDERPIAQVSDAQRRRIREACAACKGAPRGRELPCLSACMRGAIGHSW